MIIHIHVAPFTGAWIEIYQLEVCTNSKAMSLPSRERGLKYHTNHTRVRSCYVAPFTGAWIEIRLKKNSLMLSLVAPFTGAWIEIQGIFPRREIRVSRSLHGSVD